MDLGSGPVQSGLFLGRISLNPHSTGQAAALENGHENFLVERNAAGHSHHWLSILFCAQFKALVSTSVAKKEATRGLKGGI